MAVLQETWSEAERNLDEAWGHCMKGSDQRTSSFIRDLYARMALARGDYPKAKRNIGDAIEMSIQQGRVTTQLAVLSTAAAYFFQVGEEAWASELFLAVHGHPGCPYDVEKRVQALVSQSKNRSRGASMRNSADIESLCRQVSLRVK